MLNNIAVITWGLGIIAWCVIRYPHQRRARKLGVASHRRSLEERLLLSGTSIGLVALPVVWLSTGFPSSLDYSPNPVVQIGGMVVMATFLWLFYAVHRQLGKNWSITLEIREEHKLVTEGLFKHIRHPMYTSFWLWGIAQFMLLPNWLAGAAGALTVAALYFRRVYREEAMLRETFGPDYDQYMSKTKRLIPWLV